MGKTLKYFAGGIAIALMLIGARGAWVVAKHVYQAVLFAHHARLSYELRLQQKPPAEVPK